MARVELKAQETEKVVGGAFWYNTYENEDGSEYMTCYVDGIGQYNCSTKAKREISIFFSKNPNATARDGVDFALDHGYFWN